MAKSKKEKDIEIKRDIGEKIHIICKQLAIPNPLEFTIAIMAGKDPRPISDKNKHIVDSLNKIGYNPPKKEEWRALRREVLKLIQSKPAPLSMSSIAAKQLLEYSFAKKAASNDAEDQGGQAVTAPSPLTKKEVDIFHKKFSQEYV